MSGILSETALSKDQPFHFYFLQPNQPTLGDVLADRALILVSALAPYSYYDCIGRVGWPHEATPPSTLNQLDVAIKPIQRRTTYI